MSFQCAGLKLRICQTCPPQNQRRSSGKRREETVTEDLGMLAGEGAVEVDLVGVLSDSRNRT